MFIRMKNFSRWSSNAVRRRMADRGKHRVAPVPAPTKKQYAYTPCPRSEEVGTEFALQLLRTHHEEPPTPEKTPPGRTTFGGKSFHESH
ncbi:unnamed protein product [Pieris macdunnoughi]|uniref:Uncharacterized protein n=1 Tax=Pieris macdunnoughi TaxID=345717 RepID=A0A821S4P6_9NEOP|nr:unnamed protein product [Pieris macdunnoughi]